MKTRRLFLTTFALAPAWRMAHAVAPVKATCARDLMVVHGLRVPHAQWLRSERPSGDTQVLCRSVYAVPCRHARAVEALLIRKYGMAPLAFACCGWAPAGGREGQFKRAHPLADGAEAHYAFPLASEETLEKRWDRIARFLPDDDGVRGLNRRGMKNRPRVRRRSTSLLIACCADGCRAADLFRSNPCSRWGERLADRRRFGFGAQEHGSSLERHLRGPA